MGRGGDTHQESGRERVTLGKGGVAENDPIADARMFTCNIIPSQYLHVLCVGPECCISSS